MRWLGGKDRAKIQIFTAKALLPAQGYAGCGFARAFLFFTCQPALYLCLHAKQATMGVLRNMGIFIAAKEAARALVGLESGQVSEVLNDLAETMLKHSKAILHENAKDLELMEEDNPKYDRLKLTQARLESISADIRNVAMLESPLHKVLEEKVMPNGLKLTKVSVPIGVIGVIYEARPNVTFDVFSLCLSSGNACVLKGGKDSEFSNKAILRIIHEVLTRHKITPSAVQLLPVERAATEELLNAKGFVDLLIPRGSQQLIDFVRDHAKIPVVETGAGIVHIYYDIAADLEKGKSIILNAKTRRVSVCNALDCLIVHEKKLQELPLVCEALANEKVVIYADPEAYRTLYKYYPQKLLFPAKAEHFGTEFLDYKMSVKTVSGLPEALEHIAEHSSKHSEAIVSEDPKTIAQFLQLVDAAAVYANASTAFTDGAQFGLGAEIGISTQKLHARGPMGLRELTSYKWVVKGNGHIRKP